MKKKQSESNISKKDESVLVEDDKKKSDDPSWYHYLIVILVFIGFIWLVIFLGSYFEDKNQEDSEDYVKENVYMYKHVVGNVTYNLEFAYPIEDLKNGDVVNELNKYELLNSRDIFFSFKEYNGTDNMYVSTASVKLMKLLRFLFYYDFESSDFKEFNQSNCSTSTLREKVVVFDPYANESGIFYDDLTGCVEIKSQSPEEIVYVADNLMWNLIQ